MVGVAELRDFWGGRTSLHGNESSVGYELNCQLDYKNFF